MSSTFTFEAIGTQFWIEIFEDVDEKKLDATQRRIELLSSEFNQRYSRFLEDSWISILNRERSLKNPTDECIELLALGKHYYLRSQGVFNVLTGHILEARGYDATYSFVPKEGHELLNICNPLTDLMISDTEITLSCGNVDVGGYGKGYLIDLISDDLLEQGYEYFLVNGGGDMYATSDNNAPVSIYLEHPLNPKQYLMQIELLHEGFAASSPFKRQWNNDDKTYTHIIAETDVPQIATFAKAKNSVEADMFSTVCLLLPEENLPLISQTEGVAFARFDPATNVFWQTANFL